MRCSSDSYPLTRAGDIRIRTGVGIARLARTDD